MAKVSENWRGPALSLALASFCLHGEARAQEVTGGGEPSSADEGGRTLETEETSVSAESQVADDGLEMEASGQVSPAPASDPDGPSAPSQAPYIDRYRPTANLWEVGLTTGLLFPAPDHNLKVAGLPGEPYSDVSAVIGARLAYFPLSFVGVEAEAIVSPSATQVTNKSALLYAVRGHVIAQLPMLSVVPFALVGGGMFGAISQAMGNDGDPAFHFGVGVKVPVNHIVSARLDLRDTLTQKRGGNPGEPTNSFEILLGATFTFERPRPAPPPARAVIPVVVPATDKWGDGLREGAAPATSECPEGSVRGADGCAPADADHDGVLLPADRCPDAPETLNGFEDEDGCPDVLPEAVKQFTGVIPGISFTKGKSEVSPASHEALDQAADVLSKYPDVRIEVSGHTSSDGTDQVNQRLSEERARAVASYLESKGVASNRIVVRGAGSSEPIADNGTREGREQNRRIEFRVLGK